MRVVLIVLVPGQTKADESWSVDKSKLLSKQLSNKYESCFDFPCSWSNRKCELMRVDRQEFV